MMWLSTLILAPILSGVLIYSMPKRLWQAVLCGVQLYLVVVSASLFRVAARGEAVRQILGGDDAILSIELVGDRISLVLICLAVFLFSATFAYTWNDDFLDERFLLLFLVLEGLLTGIFLTDDFFNLFVLIEAATVVVSVLIMFKRDSRAIYDGLVYLLIQIVSMTFFLFGVGYIYKLFGVLSMEAVSRRIDAGFPSEALILPYSFLFTAVGLKCAFFPLFSWLPRAHGTPSAPSAVSAILSGLYVKNGLYLFIRLGQVFRPALDYSGFFLAIAVLTGVLGFLFALAQTDIKLILAFHTISQIGLIAIGLAEPGTTAFWGSLYHMLNHAVFKSLLFLTSGIIITTYGTRDIRRIRGVYWRMPVVAVASILAVLGITGAPFFNGSLSKYWIQAGLSGHIAEYAIYLINLGTVVSFVKYSAIFFGPRGERVSIDRVKSGVVAVLGALCFVGGIWATGITRSLFGVELSVGWNSYLLKGAQYFCMLALGILLYRCVLTKTKALYSIGGISLSFNRMCLMLLFFFLALTIWGRLAGLSR